MFTEENRETEDTSQNMFDKPPPEIVGTPPEMVSVKRPKTTWRRGRPKGSKTGRGR